MDRELLPYRVLSAEGVPAIMSGHLCFPLITGDGWPASLSPYFMTTLLRGRIGFKGLAVTDDLAMNGAGMRPARSRRPASRPSRRATTSL